MGIELRQKMRIGIGGTKEEGIVDVAFGGSQCKFLIKSFERGGLRVGVI